MGVEAMDRKAGLGGHSLYFAGAALLYSWSYVAETGCPGLTVYSPAGLVAALVLAVSWKMISSDRAFVRLGMAFAIIGPLGVLAFSCWSAEIPALLPVGASLYSASYSVLQLVWYEVYRRFPMGNAVLTLSGVQAGSFVLFLIAHALPKEAFLGLAILLPGMSMLLFCGSLDRVVENPSLDARDRSCEKGALSVPFFVMAACCSLAYGLSRANSGVELGVLGFGVSGILLALVVLLFAKRAGVYTLLNMALPLVALGLVLASFSDFKALFVVMLNVGYALASVVIAAFVANGSYRHGVPVLQSAGLVRACMIGGVLAGGAIARGLSESSAEASLLVSVLMVCALAGAVISWAMDRRIGLDVESESLAVEAREEKKGADKGATAEGLLESITKRSGELSAEYGLSSRETEVLIYLALGWSARMIEEKLVLSNSTVKTHTRHIYRKMGIHSRNELKALYTEGII